MPNNPHHKPAILGIAAWSGSGKTTLIKQLLPLLRNNGLRVALIKHAHHDFDIDKPGKDSYELRKAGAEQVLLASTHRTALIIEHPQKQELSIDKLLTTLDTHNLDLILVEGFKHAQIPKIELHRTDLPHPPLYPTDPHIIALACNTPPHPTPPNKHLSLLNLNNPAQVADFIIKWIGDRA